MHKKKLLAVATALTMAIGLMACGGNESGTDEKGETAAASDADSGKKEDLVLMISSADNSYAGDIEAAIEEKFGDKYNLIFKPWTSSADQNIKTAGIAGEQLDIAMYWPGSMRTMLEADMAMPLDEYMTDEWKDCYYTEKTLDMGTYDGKLYNLPYDAVYPVVVVNQDIADEVGFELSEDGAWTWDEFRELGRLVHEKNSEMYGSAINSGFVQWMASEIVLQIWDTTEETVDFSNGEISYLDEKVVAGYDMVKDTIETDCFYPGADACLAQDLDQCYAAFANKKAASIFVVNSIAAGAIENTGIENYKIMDWPNMGKNPNPALLGGADGLFIPTCAKNVDGAVEVLKFLTSSVCADIRTEGGAISTVKTSDSIAIDQEMMDALSRCADQVVDHEIHHLSTDLDTATNQQPANYISYGIESLEEMEEYRLAMEQ